MKKQNQKTKPSTEPTMKNKIVKDWKVKWIELKSYYAYATAYPVTELSFQKEGKETQNMEYKTISEEVKRYREVRKSGTIPLYLFAKYWAYYRPKEIIIKSIEFNSKTNVYKLLLNSK